MDIKKELWPGWETVRLIGQGSFGAVYELQREIRGRTEHAALKVISIPQKEDEIRKLIEDRYDDESITRYFTDSLEKIEDEYAMMADLKGHSNVVYCDEYRKVQHDDGFGWDFYIKMELLTPLKSYLNDNDKVSEAQVIKLGMDICDALKLCEELNIVHRDIKPENIFVSRNGNYKLGDFGIAKTMEGTTGGTKMGTYDYMSPEVYSNLPYHTQTDIYSLGLVMYWLLNNRTAPFLPQSSKKATPTDKAAARDRRFSGERIPNPLYGSKELKQIVLKACAFDPKDRYQSAREMREALLRLSGGYIQDGPEIIPNSDPYEDETDPTVGPVFKHEQNNDFAENGETVGPEFLPENDDTGDSGQTVGPIFSPKKKEDEPQDEKSKKKLWPVIAVVACAVLAILLYTPNSTSTAPPVNNTTRTPQVNVQEEKPKTTNSPKTTYLSDFYISSHYGKLWARNTTGCGGIYHTPNDAPDCWSDWSMYGFSIGKVKDNSGNEYDFGLHIDGHSSEVYYYEIQLNGEYSEFSGVCACPERSAAISNYVYNASTKYTKYFEVYGDGKLLYTSPTMRYDYAPQSFKIDVTNVQVLRIQYPATKGPNEIATLYDGKLS